ncbi:MAG: hypothetical protein JXA90_10855, partial [Planctomycetes bacterium]|nr:hypothetical protein [Planctomycetota bacterium]
MMLPPVLLAAVLAAASEAAAPLRLESAAMLVEVDPAAGRWSLTDKASGVRWPTEGTASPGEAAGLEGKPAGVEARGDETLRIAFAGGRGVLLALRRGGRDLELRWEGEGLGDVRALGDLLRVADREDGFAIVPCREGLLVSARSGQAFRRAFGTSDYEGCHMNLLGFAKRGSALLVTWEGAYVFPELSSELRGEGSSRQTLTALFSLRRSARSLRITPLGPGDWN